MHKHTQWWIGLLYLLHIDIISPMRNKLLRCSTLLKAKCFSVYHNSTLFLCIHLCVQRRATPMNESENWNGAIGKKKKKRKTIFLKAFFYYWRLNSFSSSSSSCFSHLEYIICASYGFACIQRQFQHFVLNTWNANDCGIVRLIEERRPQWINEA